MDDSEGGASAKAPRYYYPVNRAHHAYCMAKDFGMEFESSTGKWEPESLLHLAGATNYRIYVHADSLHLLDPQLGDIITANDSAIDYHGYCFRLDVLYRTYADGSYGTDEFACTKSACRSRDVRVIQRNRGGLIAFHWPECEAA